MAASVRIAVVAAAWLASAPAAPRASEPAQHPAQVTTLVTVISESGAAITDLSAADFVVREAGQTREVASASPANAASLFVAILLDTSKPPMGTPPPVNDVRTSLSTFVSTIRAANPGAQISLTEVSGAAVPVVKFDAGTEALDSAIARLYPGQRADAVMLEGLADVASELAGISAMRKAIVSIDFNSNDPTSAKTAKEAIEAVSQSRASVWAISVRGTRGAGARRDAGLKAAAEMYGGHQLSAISPSGLTAMLTQTAASLSSQYLVAFTRPADAELKPITVETARGQKALVVLMMR